MRRNTWLSLAATMVMGAGAALAAPGSGPDGAGGPPPRGMGPGGMGGGGLGIMDGGAAMIGVPSPRMLDRMAADLNLTADQQQKLKGVFESARPEMEQVRDRARENADKLRSAQPGSANYDAVVSEVARNAGDLASRAVTNGAQLRTQVWAILTPEQRQKLETLQAQRRTAMKERLQKRREARGERR
jgi:Spy/CpxP family protein refolding chaperone